MSRRIFMVGVVLVLSGCCMDDRSAAPALPGNIKSLDYYDLLTRAKAQLNFATEAFYTDSWAELREAAVGLEQTAMVFDRATDVPAIFKNKLPGTADELAKQAVQLQKQADGKDINAVNSRLQSIHLTIREFHYVPKSPDS